MYKVFEVFFWTGTLFTVVGFIFGQFFDFLGIDGDIDFDGDLFGLTVFPLKPVTLAAFATVFGGLGMILFNMGVYGILSIVLAAAAGISTAFIIFRFIIIPLKKAQSTSAVSQEELIGINALVKVDIRGNSFGRIAYTACGNSFTGPAKSIDGSDIEKGKEVLIVKIDKHIFYVIKK